MIAIQNLKSWIYACTFTNCLSVGMQLTTQTSEQPHTYLALKPVLSTLHTQNTQDAYSVGVDRIWKHSLWKKQRKTLLAIKPLVEGSTFKIEHKNHMACVGGGDAINIQIQNELCKMLGSKTSIKSLTPSVLWDLLPSCTSCAWSSSVPWVSPSK